MKVDQEGYNGPTKEAFIDALGEYEEYRFEIMRYMSKAGKVIASWEKSGGCGDDLRDGYRLRKMEPDDQRAELRRQFRVAGWLNIVDQDRAGQSSFLKVFDVKEPELGIGGAPLGSRLSVVRAKSAGYNDGKSKNGPSLQDGIELYVFDAESEEALAYAEGYGEGLLLRPAPKAKKSDDAEGDAPAGEAMSALEVMTETLKELDGKEAAKRKRGRPPKLAALPAPADEPVTPEPTVDSVWGNGFVPRLVN